MDTQSMLLRFVAGRPVSAVPTQVLAWLTERLAAEGKTALLMVGDNAAWHVSQAVRTWRKAHKRRVKRAIAEPNRKLHVDELQHRICAYYDCELLEPITQ
jgi:hypothetical protein